MRLRLSPEARVDLRIIHDYVAARNAGAARELVLALRARCNELLVFPNVGSKRADLGVGVQSVTHKSYVILYKTGKKRTLWILGIIHGRRRIEDAIESRKDDWASY